MRENLSQQVPILSLDGSESHINSANSLSLVILYVPYLSSLFLTLKTHKIKKTHSVNIRPPNTKILSVTSSYSIYKRYKFDLFLPWKWFYKQYSQLTQTLHNLKPY